MPAKASPDAVAAQISEIAASFALPDVHAAAAAVARGDLREAERLVRGALARTPGSIAATVILADIAARVGIYQEAERLLRDVLARVPFYVDAAINLSQVFVAQGRTEDALALLDGVLADAPAHVRAAGSRAELLAQTGRYAEAAETYRELVSRVPDRAEIWMWFGNLLKTIGRQNEAVEAYRRAITLDGDLAEAWWSLAELKANRIDRGDIDAIEDALARATSDERRLYLHFALGKAREDLGEWETSFSHYAAGNALRLAREPHDRAAVTAEVERSTRTYTRAFYAARRGWGFAAPDPIFIIGMPRAGSTLIEQILASHSQVEGTAELPDIPLMVQALVARRWQDASASYPGVVETLDPATVEELGRRYLASTAQHRKTDAPFFIDKLPNNWRYLGLIRLILPNAKIVDARRGAMACCFSNFKQHFAQGQTFAYSQADLGAYYRDYIRAVAHFEGVQPGVVHRVEHEALLADPEGEIRRLLAALGLPFENACLRPHENARPVRTASSEQVRRPINRDAVDRWRHYAPWLGDLRGALGDLA